MAISNYEVCKNIGPQGLTAAFNAHSRCRSGPDEVPSGMLHGGKPLVIQVLNASTKDCGNGSNGGGGMPGEGPVI